MARDGASYSNINATTGEFALLGGRYAIAGEATGTGTMGLQIKLPNGTFVAAHVALSANGFVIAELPPGTYKFVIATFTAVYIAVSGIPQG